MEQFEASSEIDQLDDSLWECCYEEHTRRYSNEVLVSFRQLLKLVGTTDSERITLTELNSALGNPLIKGREARTLALLKSKFDSFSSSVNHADEPPREPAVSLSSMERFDRWQREARGSRDMPPDALKLVGEVEDFLREMDKVVAETVPKLFASLRTTEV